MQGGDMRGNKKKERVDRSFFYRFYETCTLIPGPMVEESVTLPK